MADGLNLDTWWDEPEYKAAQAHGTFTERGTFILNKLAQYDAALRLGHFFGTSPEFWLNLQSLYELRLAEQQAGRRIRALPTLKRRKGRGGRQPVPA